MTPCQITVCINCCHCSQCAPAASLSSAACQTCGYLPSYHIEESSLIIPNVSKNNAILANNIPIAPRTEFQTPQICNLASFNSSMNNNIDSSTSPNFLRNNLTNILTSSNISNANMSASRNSLMMPCPRFLNSLLLNSNPSRNQVIANNALPQPS